MLTLPRNAIAVNEIASTSAGFRRATRTTATTVALHSLRPTPPIRVVKLPAP